MPDEPDVIRVLNEYRAALDAKEYGLMWDMGNRWMDIEHRLDNDIALLARETAERYASGTEVTEQMLWKMERYNIVRNQMEEEIHKYNKFWAVEHISEAQKSYSLLGIDAAQAAINVQYGPMGKYFTRINLEAVKSMIGFAGDGSPLNKLLSADYPDAVDGLTKALINGITRGQGAAQTAKEMADGMGMGLERAMLIARTETARAYRTGSTEQYRESGVVNGFMRLVKKATACMACLMLDGQIFTKEQELTDHPRGKCSVIPIVDGVNIPQYEHGKEWFEKQDEATQRKLMGDTRYEAWKDGKIELDDLHTMEHNSVWGDSPRAKTLDELGIEKAKKVYPSAPKTGPKVQQPIKPAGLGDAKPFDLGKMSAEKTHPSYRSELGHKCDQATIRETNFLDKDNPGHFGEDLQKDDICKYISQDTGIEYDKVNNFIHNWAQTSNDSSIDALMAQKRASELFDTPFSDWQDKKLQEAMKKFGPSYRSYTDEEIDKMLQSMYARTQKELAEDGITELTLFRGVDVDETTWNEMRNYFLSGDPVAVTENAMESWSTKIITAMGFAGDRPVVLGQVIPASRIIGSARTGYGCWNEFEFVVLGGRNDFVKVLWTGR